MTPARSWKLVHGKTKEDLSKTLFSGLSRALLVIGIRIGIALLGEKEQDTAAISIRDKRSLILLVGFCFVWAPFCIEHIMTDGGNSYHRERLS